jgi:putative transposase
MKVIHKAYKFRLYPNEEQEILINKHFGCTRFIYNWALDLSNKSYQIDKKRLKRFDLQAKLPAMKKANETEWLKEVNSLSLQATLKHLDNGFSRFFTKKGGYPKFKSKHDNNKSFEVPANTIIDVKNKKISIPKFKKGIKARLHRTIPKKGIIKTSTVSMNPSGQYFISILVEEPLKEKKYKKPTMKNSVGVDLGIKDFATLSDGTKIENPKFLKKNLKKLKKEQRRLSKKQKGSNNRNKQRIKVARLHNKISNMRNDFLHKLTTKLVSENQAICLEDLNVKGMIKNHNLAQAIQDVSWSKFNTLLEYKAEWNSVSILRIGRFEPSSKMCSCGVINKDLKLSDRIWTCKDCGATHDRDVLASQNIKTIGLHSYKTYNKKIGKELPKLTPVESKSLDPQRSRKSTHQS